MSLETPTTAEIDATIIAQLQATLNQSVPLLPKAFLRVLSRTLAGVFIILYKYAGFNFLQMFVRTATIDETDINGISISPLTAWGQLIGVGDLASATRAELEIEITVNNQVGTLPSQTQLVGALNGVTYHTIGAVALSAATVNVSVRAVSDQAGGDGSGAIGNLDVSDEMSFANPLANVERTTTVITVITTGADAEATEAYRQRVLDRFQKRPQGGAYADYEQWAEEPAGILNAYPYTAVDPGQVDIYIEATVESSGDPDGFPTAAQLQEALDATIFDPSGVPNRRPANALSNTFSITRQEFNVEITGLAVDNPGQTQQDIEDALTEYFLDRGPFIVGLTIPPRRDRITGPAVTGIVDDIVSAVNGIFTSAVIDQGGGPITLFELGVGEKAKVGTVSFV